MPSARPGWTPEQWREISGWFERALELPESEREGFLVENCPDSSQRTWIRELLVRSSPAFLEEGAVAFAAPALADLGLGQEETPALGGRQLGPYRLDHEIGRGGMSVVYLADRVDGQFSQQVAIKLLRHPAPDRDLVSRFTAERQFLGALDHPRIARILDGGVGGEGWPYLVMEHVKGPSITDWCREGSLNLDERLTLFLEVCDAVQHAHQRFVVHRDLKPSNILVHDDGHVKLLDFGIAKLLDSESGLSFDTPVTRTGVHPLTPDYAAPEQVRGLPVTAATDVYALGIVLFELLADTRPYRLEDKSAAEMERIICETEPVPPSAALRAGIPPADSVTTHRIEQRSRDLRGDLDTICLKALNKDAERRYGSARELAEDIERFRSGLPVLARPATRTYRIGKFVRRHRGQVAALAGILVLSLGFAAAMGLQRGVTEQARVRAETESARSREVSSFLAGLFTASNPYVQEGTDDLTALDLLERGLERLASVKDPEVRATMLDVIGEAHLGLARYEKARELFEESLALNETRYGAASREAALSRNRLGTALRRLGRYEEARVVQEAALRDLRAAAPTGVEAAETLRNLGEIRQAMGEYAPAESLFMESLSLLRLERGDRDEETVRSLSALVYLLAEQGDLRRAIAVQDTIVAVRRSMYPEGHPLLAESLSDLGSYHRRQGNFAEAEPPFLEAIAIQKNWLGERHPDLAYTIGNLGVLYGTMGRDAASESLFTISLAILEDRLGEDHPQVATACNNLSNIVRNRGDLDRAEAFQQRALAIRRRALGPDHPLIAASLASLSQIQQRQGRLPEAIATAEEGLAMERRLYKDRNVNLSYGLGNLGYFHYLLGNYDVSIRHHREALELRMATFGGEHPDVATSMRSLGVALRDKGEREEAELLLRRSLALRRNKFGEGHPRTAEVCDDLGVLLTLKGRYAEADTLLNHGLAVRRTQMGDDHPLVRESVRHLVDLYRAWGRKDKAAEARALLDSAG